MKTKIRKFLSTKLFWADSLNNSILIIIIILLTFILWSFLAILSATANPFGKLNFSFIPYFASNNLVVSLVRDIIRPYFSFFTIISLAFIFGILRTSNQTVSGFFHEIYKSRQTDKGNAKSLFPMVFGNNGQNNFESIAQGKPTAIKVDANSAILVGNRDTQKLVVNSNDEKEIFITGSGQDFVVDRYDLSPIHLHVPVINHTEIFNAPRLDFLISCHFKFSGTRVIKDQSPQIMVFNLCDSRDLRSYLERIITSEFKAAFRDFCKDSFRQNTPQSFLTLSNSIGSDSQSGKNDLSAKNTGFLIYPLNKFKRQMRRNRRRFVITRHKAIDRSGSSNIEKDSSRDLVKTLNKIFNQNLKKPLLRLFGADIIEAETISISKES